MEKSLTLNHQLTILLPQLKRFAYKFNTTNEIREDGLANALIKIINNYDKFDGKRAKFTTWCHTIVKNEILIEIHRHKKLNYSSTSIEDLKLVMLEEEEIDESINAIIINVMEEIEELPPILKKIAELRYYQNIKINNIAIQLKINENTIKTYLGKIRKILSKKVSLDALYF